MLTDFFFLGHYNANPESDKAEAEADYANEQREKAAAAAGEVAFQNNEYTIPFQSDNFQVNGSRNDKKRERNKLRNNNNNTKNKENVKLQKFVTLREANGANDETDI